MSWKHVFNNSHARLYYDLKVTELAAYNSGYKFYVFNGDVYFITGFDCGNGEGCLKSYPTGITAEELV
jgi:hypothetical protein